MSSLSDKLTAQTAVQRHRGRLETAFQKYETLVDWDEQGLPSEVGITLPTMPEDEKAWREEIKRVVGITIPEERQVLLEGTRYWGNPEAPNIYCRFKIQDRVPETERLDLEEILSVVKKAKAPKKLAKVATDTALVVALADLQIGKVGSRGGTEELVARVMDKLDAMEAHIKKVKPSSIYLLDVGDCVESFENTASQMYTNDLSFPEQLRVARRLFLDAVTRVAKLAPEVVVAGIPSNHGRWRRGKDNLGKPGDDFGIENILTVADVCSVNPAAYGHVSFVVPDDWEESLTLDINGTYLGLIHGHQVNRPEQIPTWWANQTHGGQPVSDADILLTGHFHHLRVQPTGRNPHTNRSKWFFQAPTLDNGSDWYRVRSGSDSDPGLLVFEVTSQGWDGLKVL